MYRNISDLLGETVSSVSHPLRERRRKQDSGTVKRYSMLAVLLLAGSWLLMATAVSPASASVGELGPPPTEPDVWQVVAGLYDVGQPPNVGVNLQFFGPITVGPAIPHDNPNPDSGSSPMYPVNAQIRVTTTYPGHSESDPPSVVTVDYYGPPPTGDGSYYFYRDQQGNWQVPVPICTRCGA
jgi:hypothetical protein